VKVGQKLQVLTTLDDELGKLEVLFSDEELRLLKSQISHRTPISINQSLHW
jgi:hypothetical protein